MAFSYLTPKEETQQQQQLQAWEKELSQISQRLLWITKQRLFALHILRTDGPWIREYYSLRKRKTFGEALRYECKLRGGCCERDCGCCSKPRQASSSSGWQRKEAKTPSHCTINCGCCIRNRGFHKPDASVIKNDLSRLATERTAATVRIWVLKEGKKR